MIDLIWQLAAGVGVVAGIIWAAYTRGKKNESTKRDAERLEADIETMERINADNPNAGLPVDERLQRHTGRK